MHRNEAARSADESLVIDVCSTVVDPDGCCCCCADVADRVDVDRSFDGVPRGVGDDDATSVVGDVAALNVNKNASNNKFGGFIGTVTEDDVVPQ